MELDYPLTPALPPSGTGVTPVPLGGRGNFCEELNFLGLGDVLGEEIRFEWTLFRNTILFTYRKNNSFCQAKNKRKK
ncbi:MAG: hypothetical protein A2V86_09720 [Deltaproteobacteria bacterium RBG_16_49_23]|nr:MAG: hypothetical protein A2V86_09720 [Deltaproteobacteria bacterium RBG_16_49_23]